MATFEHVLLDRLHVPLADFEAGTGWHVEPHGLCRGDVCVPLSPGTVTDGVVDVEVVADRAGMPLIPDEVTGVWALAPMVAGGTVLSGADVPDLELPAFDGGSFDLRSTRGRKVVFMSWASW